MISIKIVECCTLKAPPYCWQ